jgi:hypothetical protein
MAVWAQAAGGFNVAPFVLSIWSAAYDVATHTWGPPVYLSGDLTQPNGSTINLVPAYPRVAMDGSGHAMAVWEQNNGHSSVTSNLWAARYTAGLGWAAPAAITTDNNVSPGNRSIGFDGSGNATAIFTTVTTVNGGGDVRVKAIRYSAGSGTWGAEQFLATDTGQPITIPQLAVSAAGDALAVWTQSNGTRIQMVANHFSAATSTWGSLQVLDPLQSVDSSDAQVAMDGIGNGWAIWTTLNQVWASRYTAGGGWAAAVAIEATPSTSSRYPQVTFDPNGNAMAVWVGSTSLVQNGPLESLVKASACPAGGTWATPQLLETVSGQSGDPQVVLDATGKATAIWDKMDAFPGVNTTIWAARSQ